MSIASDVRDYIEDTTSLTNIGLDSFGSTVNTMIIRSDPSTANIEEFIDGSYKGQQQLTLYARNTNPDTAQSNLETARAAVDKKKITLTGVGVAKVVAGSTVSFVNKETTGEFVYSTTVDVTYDGKNPIGV